ncbi:MAG: universal stress protein [Proteobacteria bacterium]|nr:universal stress protein [Pseudomonadota bacterium]
MASVKRKVFLVAVDASDISLTTVNYLAELIPAESMEVVLLHVFSGIPEVLWDTEPDPKHRRRFVSISLWEERQRNKIQALMEKAWDVFRTAGVPEKRVKIRIENRVQDVARDIIAEARRTYDAIILRHRATFGLKHRPLGGVVDKIINTLDQTNICVVKGTPASEGILVAMDLSEASKRAVDFVSYLIKGRDRDITLFYAAKRMGFLNDLKDVNGEAEELEKTLLQESIRLVEPRIAEAKSRLIMSGLDEKRISAKIVTGVSSRAGAILDEAERRGCGTIVMGRKGLSNIKEFPLGRVTHKVLNFADDKAVWTVA